MCVCPMRAALVAVLVQIGKRVLSSATRDEQGVAEARADSSIRVVLGSRGEIVENH